MKFSQFEHIISPKRVERYLVATGHRTKKTMLLYNANLNLAKEMYVVINYFEVALRNAIDVCLQQSLGPDWLRDSIMQGGIFDNKHCEKMKKAIESLSDKEKEEYEIWYADHIKEILEATQKMTNRLDIEDEDLEDEDLDVEEW